MRPVGLSLAQRSVRSRCYRWCRSGVGDDGGGETIAYWLPTIVSSSSRTTVWSVSYEPMTLAQLASLIATAADVEHRRLLFAEFLEEHQHESPSSRWELIADRPPSTGIHGWDALLAGLAEHLAEVDQVDAPRWVEDSSRFLDEPWCYFDLPFFRAEAERETPKAFRRHGVLIRAVELERV